MLGAAEAARAIRRLDIGGSIGIDLPTVAGKAGRQAADDAIDAILPKPFERTAMNGFGFVQIVRPRTPRLARSSWLRIAPRSRPAPCFAGRRSNTPEPSALVAHPAVIAVLDERPDWLDALVAADRRRGQLAGRPTVPMSGGYAESA